MNDLFDTQSKRDSAIASFTSLLSHPGWKLLEEIMDINIKELTAQLENGVEGETKEDIDLIRYKLSFTKEHRNKPKDLIEKLQPVVEGTEPNSDPFPTVESLRKLRSA